MTALTSLHEKMDLVDLYNYSTIIRVIAAKRDLSAYYKNLASTLALAIN